MMSLKNHSLVCQTKFGLIVFKTFLPLTVMYSILDKNTVAKEIEKTVRIICCVMTCPKNHPIRSSHLKATWGKRCTELLFMSTTTSEGKF